MLAYGTCGITNLGVRRSSVPSKIRYHSFHSYSLFILRYDDVRNADAPEQILMDFLQSTYEGAVQLSHWDREAMER